MSDYLKAACKHVGATPEQVLASHVDEAGQVYVLVIDNGVKGCPKHVIPLSELITMSEPVEVETAVTASDEPIAEPQPAPKRSRKKK